MPGNFACFCFLSSAADFLKKNLSGIPSVSNRLEPDQARHFVGPDLGPNCLQNYLQTKAAASGKRVETDLSAYQGSFNLLMLSSLISNRRQFSLVRLQIS